MITLREKIVNARKTGNIEVYELKKEKICKLRKLIRTEKALLNQMSKDNYQKQIENKVPFYESEDFQSQLQLISYLEKKIEVLQVAAPKKLQTYSCITKEKTKTFESVELKIKNRELRVENSIEQVCNRFRTANLENDLTNDLWCFWLKKKKHILSKFYSRSDKNINFDQYIYKVLKNHYFDTLEYEYKHQGMSFDSETVNVTGALGAFHAADFSENDVFEKALDTSYETNTEQKIKYIKKHLTSSQLRILELRANGLKYELIARQLGFSIRTIKRQVQAIKDNLKNSIGENYLQWNKMRTFKGHLASPCELLHTNGI